MTGEGRLAEVVAAFERLGVAHLVMGGHAARFYGVDRTTVDYDLHVAVDDWSTLADMLVRDPFLANTGVQEGPSWRPAVFRRFAIGRLPDGREEWLELWKENHLLAPFAEMFGRRELGLYGGREMPFLSLPDLMRSKETERESDWRDIELLEECHDARNLARAGDDESTVAALSRLRSRSGFESAAAAGTLARGEVVTAAYTRAHHPISLAYLSPFATGEPAGLEAVDTRIAAALRSAAGGSPRHLALVEAVRRLYKQRAMAADRADKARALA